MSTSHRAQARRQRRPDHATSGIKLEQCPDESDSDLSVHYHHSPKAHAEDRLSAMPTPSSPHGSTTTASPGTPRASSASPAKPPTHDAPTPLSNAKAAQKTTARQPAAGGARVSPAVEGVSDNTTTPVAYPNKDGATALRTTPEKTLAIRAPAESTPASQMRVGSEGRIEDVMQRPIEESLSFEFYHNKASGAAEPRNVRSTVHNPYRESPVSPTVLPMMRISGGISQRYTALGSSHEQQPVERYGIMSQSSRLEDTQPLPVSAAADGTGVSAERGAAAYHRAQHLDDMVRNSTTESISAEGNATSSSAQPPRVDSSMNSQYIMKISKRRNPVTAPAMRGGAAGGRYGSISTSGSPQMSADMAAPNATGCSGPQLLSSDQLTQLPHGLNRRRVGAGGADDTPFGRQEGNVLGMGSSDGFTPAASRPAITAAPPHTAAPPAATDEYAMVRAPISGLRAKVLGNNAIDDEEAAEDPEARELLAEQIKSFVTKVVRQHHDGGAPESAAAAEPETRADILRRANAEAAAMDAKEPCCPTPVSIGGGPDGKVGIATYSSTEEVLPKKSKKRVRFNLEGLVLRDEEGPNALHMPRHSTQRSSITLQKRPESPLVFTRASSDAPALAADDDARGGRSGPRSPALRTSTQGVDVRSLLRNGVAHEPLTSPTTPPTDALTNSRDAGARYPVSPPTPSGPVVCSNSYVNGQSTLDDDDRPLFTPLTPMVPTSAVPPTLIMTPAKAVPVPPAPTVVSQLTTSQQEPQKKRKPPAGKIRKASKMHRKAAVALVSGASDSVTVAPSSTSSSTQHSDLASLQQAHASVMSSIEVCLPEGSTRRSRTFPQHLLRMSLTNPNFHSAQAASASPSPLRTAADTKLSKPPHRVIVAGGTPGGVSSQQQQLLPPSPSLVPGALNTPPPLRATQVVPVRQSFTSPTPSVSSTVPGLPMTPKGSRTSYATGGAGGTGSAPASRRSSLSLASATPARSVHNASRDLSGLPPTSPLSRSQSTTPDVLAPPPAARDAAAAAVAAEVHVLLPPALARRGSTSHDTVPSVVSVAESGAVVGIRKERPTASVGPTKPGHVLSAESTLSELSTSPSTARHSSSLREGQSPPQGLPRLSSNTMKPSSPPQVTSPPSH